MTELAADPATTSVPDEDGQVQLVRSFSVDLTPGDGRTIDAMIVPYNTVARVADAPHFIPYDERFLPGAFEPQTRAPDRVKVLLDFEHQAGISGIIGRGTKLDEQADGLYGTFRVLDGQDGDKALQLVNDGVLTGMSVFGRPMRTRVKDGIVERVRVHLDRVALCREPAYPGAQVLAVREAPAEKPVLPLVVPAVPPLDRERLSRLGIMPMFERAVVRTAWDASRERFTDEEFQRSCLIDGQLPVLEPNGDLNVNALPAAAGRLRQVRDVTADQRVTAARKLVRYYRMAEMEPPPAIRVMAG